MQFILTACGKDQFQKFFVSLKKHYLKGEVVIVEVIDAVHTYCLWQGPVPEVFVSLKKLYLKGEVVIVEVIHTYCLWRGPVPACVSVSLKKTII